MVLDVNFKIAWTALKSLAASKVLRFQYLDQTNVYVVFVVENDVIWYTHVQKTTPENADQIDFQNNYQPSANQQNLERSIAHAHDPSGNPIAIAADEQGRLITTSLTGFNADFTYGEVATSATTANQVIRKTAYTEQTTNAQRQILSSSANDSAAGTGARTVRVTYFDQTGAGPFVETVTMNGVTAVNTVATNICFIEKIEVMTVGSTRSNVGIITLRTLAAATIGTIAATDNITKWTHHYVPVGKTCRITGISIANTSTAIGNAATFILRAITIGSSNQPDKQISDVVRVAGQAGTTTRTYVSPIIVAGPARVTAYVTPQSSVSVTQFCAIDYFEP